MIVLIKEKVNGNITVNQTCLIHKVIISNNGSSGASAYQIAVANGFVGTEKQWLDSLKYKPLIRRHDFEDNTSYCGSAFQGTEETAPSWNIVKIEVSPEGTTIKKQATNVDWINRLTHNYI